jgi:hypothetical protein
MLFKFLLISFLILNTMQHSVAQSEFEHRETYPALPNKVSIEDQEWREWRDSRIKLSVPEGAVVAIVAGSEPKPEMPVKHWQYLVILKGRRVVMTIDVFQGGPEFIEVMAGEESDYTLEESQELKTWTLDVDGFTQRTTRLTPVTMVRQSGEGS